MIIKVCGMREAKNIRAVEQAGADWIGFIFYKESPRYVSQIKSRAGIIPDYSSLENENGTVAHAKRVGVFVDEMPQNIGTRIVNYNLDAVQLHGDESSIMIDNLRRTVDPDIHPGIKIIKAIGIETSEDLKQCDEFDGHVDYFLFDTKTTQKGGSGKPFDWDVLKAYNGKTPFFLSGGIGPDYAERIKKFSHPQFAGIDLNSQFETEPAVKDAEMLKEFIEAVRK